MNAAQKRAFTRRWLGSREVLFSACDNDEEPPSRPHVSRVVFKWALRPATLDDLDGLCALEKLCFETDRISRRQFRRYVVSPNAIVLVMECDGEIAGAAVVTFRKDSARLYSLSIAPRFRGRGYGLRLLGTAEREARSRRCRKMRLEVRHDNAAAIALYRKTDYEEGGCIARYYDDGTDALLFEKKLSAMSRTNTNNSSRNLILDGHIRIEPDPRYGVYWLRERKLWAMWGYRWRKIPGSWSDIQLFYCRRFEMEDEPI